MAQRGKRLQKWARQLKNLSLAAAVNLLQAFHDVFESNVRRADDNLFLYISI